MAEVFGSAGEAEPSQADASAGARLHAPAEAASTPQKRNRRARPEAPSNPFQNAWKSVRTHFVFVMLFSAAINLLYLSPSLFMLQVYDRVIPSKGLLTLVFLGVALVAALSVMSSLDAARARLLARASLRIELLGASPVMREALANRRAGVAGRSPAGMRELDALRQAFNSPATTGLIDLPWTPLFIFVSFAIHFWIGMLSLVGAAAILILALFNERASRQTLGVLAGASSQFQAAHDSDLRSAETVHALGLERALITKRLATREVFINAQTDSAFVISRYSAGTKLMRQILQSASLGLGAYLAIERQISPGSIIACSILTARAYAPVEQIVAGWRQLGLSYSAYKSLSAMFKDAPPQRVRTPLPPPRGEIVLDNVVATAPGSPVPAITGVYFSARPGETIAIIGPSGAGKTTLARVLANAAPLRAGTIRIDGAKYQDWDPAALAQYVGYMPQSVDLFDGTVTDNISRFARENGAEMQTVGPKVIAAAREADAHDLILSLPQGYDTVLSAGGGGLSPGQAQRIALARALYGAPPVLVLDEPNAHLDSDGDAALSNALVRHKQRGGLAFVVAHRTAVLAVVDRVILLHRGVVASIGERDQVLAQLQGRKQANAAPELPVSGAAL